MVFLFSVITSTIPTMHRRLRIILIRKIRLLKNSQLPLRTFFCHPLKSSNSKPIEYDKTTVVQFQSPISLSSSVTLWNSPKRQIHHPNKEPSSTHHPIDRSSSGKISSINNISVSLKFKFRKPFLPN